MAKILNNEGLNRIRAASAFREAAARAVDNARRAWAETRSDSAREFWRLALLEEEKADAEYWAVTGEYFQDLSPKP